MEKLNGSTRKINRGLWLKVTSGRMGIGLRGMKKKIKMMEKKIFRAGKRKKWRNH